MANSCKGVKKQNFTTSERLTLIEEFVARKDVLQQKFRSSLTNKEKQKAWAEVAAAVNAVSPVERSLAECKEKWTKLSSEARTQLRARKYPPTGSGKTVEMPDLDLFELIFGSSDLIEGIPSEAGGFGAGDESPKRVTFTRSSTPDRPDAAEETAFEVITDDQGILYVAGTGPLSPMSSSAPSQPGSTHSSVAGDTPGTSGLCQQRSSAATRSCADPPKTAGPSNFPSTSRKTSQTRRLAAQDTQSELYTKYLSVGIDLKQCLMKQLETETSDTELKELEKEKKRLEVQTMRVAFEVKEMEKEKLRTEIKQAAEIHELEREKLKWEIELAKQKTGQIKE